ncbi:MAG TPA: hypothetical protein VKA92_11145 [Segetibacter sp.]|nr:hypothetical protein [Segetibacter sp.]
MTVETIFDYINYHIASYSNHLPFLGEEVHVNKHIKGGQVKRYNSTKKTNKN